MVETYVVGSFGGCLALTILYSTRVRLGLSLYCIPLESD